MGRDVLGGGSDVLSDPVGSINLGAPDGSGGLDTGKLVDALTRAANAGGRAWVQMQPGIYSVDPDAVAVPDGTTLAGMGIGGTQIEKTGNGCLIDMSGTSSTRKQRCQIRDVRLVGRVGAGTMRTGPLIRQAWTSQSHIQNVECAFNDDTVLDMTSVWDTNVDNFFADWSGSLDGTNPAIWVKNSDAAHTEAVAQTNMVRFQSTRIESFRKALRVERGAGSAVDPYGIFFYGIKMETSFVRSEIVRVSNVRHISMHDVEITGNAFDAGVSTAVVGIFWSPLERSLLDGVRLHQPGNFINQLVNPFIPTTGAHSIRNVSSDPSATAPSVGLIVWGANGSCDVRNVYSPGTIHSGATPMFPSVASATSIAIPRDCDAVNVTGTTAITAMTGGTIGKPVTLIFAAAATLTHNGSSIKLNGGVNFVASADDSITVLWDGSGWRQVAPASLN